MIEQVATLIVILTIINLTLTILFIALKKSVIDVLFALFFGYMIVIYALIETIDYTIMEIKHNVNIHK